jgi:cytochrome bd ubiquinol oxidase subunit I
VLTAAFAVGGSFVAAVSAWHLLRRTADTDFFRRSLRLGAVVGFLGVWATIFTGYAQLGPLATNQPTKSAALHGNATRLAQLQSELAARFGPGRYTPPGWVATAFQVMLNVGTLWTLVMLVAVILLFRDWILRTRPLLWILAYLMPVLFIAAISGWLVREIGRQPWVVYEQLRTAQAASTLHLGQVVASTVIFFGITATLAVVDYMLIVRTAARGPDRMALGTAPAAPLDVEIPVALG